MSGEDVRFLIKRMDTMESRIVEKIDALQAFKNKLIGIAIIAGSIASILVELLHKSL